MRATYRKETDPELIAAATAAYNEAPPQVEGNRTMFARNRNRPPLEGLAGQVARADQRPA